MSMPGLVAMWAGGGTMRPISVAFTGTPGSHSNDGNAYDTDPNTFATVSSAVSGATSSYTATYTIGAAPAGVLSVAITTATMFVVSDNGLNEATTDATVQYALDGSTWTLLDLGSGGSELDYSSPITASIGAASNLLVRVTCSYVRIGTGLGLAIASSSADIYDIKLN